MTVPVDPARALVFGELADEYAKHRPTYPDEAVAWLTDGASVVADLGAGTGQLTGQMLDRGVTVHSVEPDERMLHVLRREHPTALPHCSTADRIPLKNHSVDAVLSADAWHWFPVDETIVEVRRVLKPGGWLGLVWNVPTPVADWEFELAGIDPDKKGVRHAGTSTPAGPGFGPFPDNECDRESFRWAWPITPEGFGGYLATNSGVMILSASEREHILDSSEAVVRDACVAAGAPSVAMHHTATCFRWRPTPETGA